MLRACEENGAMRRARARCKKKNGRGGGKSGLRPCPESSVFNTRLSAHPPFPHAPCGLSLVLHGEPTMPPIPLPGQSPKPFPIPLRLLLPQEEVHSHADARDGDPGARSFPDARKFPRRPQHPVLVGV
jgi:hypothetical protein